ncbi:MAG: asparagine synthase (glutamine-hydrolyzing) [Elusimicrobiota bacterium]
MCGICGIININSEKIEFSELKKMNDLLIHRGPDDEGFFVKDNFSIASRRLSIIDLDTGRQPISNEEKTAYIVLNGEIYNYLDLRNELIKKGHKFSTKSDTETVIHLYEEYGKDFVKKLRGMFALCILDLKEKKIILARDRIGKKPLFYYFDNKRFIFSSEINPILSLKDIKLTLNLKAIDTYLVLQYIPSPMTVYNEIKKLDPSSILELKDNEIKIEKYWDVPSNSININFNEAREKLKDLIMESVRLRMIADVPVGAFLSGGIDSSVIVASMCKLSNTQIKTFSIGFSEDKFSELEYAREVARMYNTDHHEFIVKDDMTDILPALLLHYGEPYADPSALPSYYVSKITSKYVKVALNGDGGDENFGGYWRYLAEKIAYSLRLMPKSFFRSLLSIISLTNEGVAPFSNIWKIRKFLKMMIAKNIERSYLSTVSFFSIDEKNEFLSEQFKALVYENLDFAEKYIMTYFNNISGNDIIKRISYVDFNTYLPQCLMTKMDIASMANSLEARSPFLDHKLIEFSLSLDSEYKIKGYSNTKYILKEAFKDMLPEKILKRGKMGFGIPLGLWFRKGLKQRFEDTCLSENALRRGYFKPQSLKKLWYEHQTGKRDHGYKLWTVLILELWHRKFMDDFKL